MSPNLLDAATVLSALVLCLLGHLKCDSFVGYQTVLYAPS